MTKRKTVLIWCLALALLVLGGSLPTLAALMGDRLAQGSQQYRDMDSLELIFDNGKALSPGTKLALLQSTGQQQVGIEPADGAQDILWNQLMPVIFAQLDQYIAAGVLPDSAYDAELISTDAFLMYLPREPEINTTMWNLGFAVEGEERLHLVVDGDMGQILAIEYIFSAKSDENEAPAASHTDWEPMLDVAVYQYFRSLGLTATQIDEQRPKDGISKTFEVETEYGYAYVVCDLFSSYFSIYPQ